MELMNILSLFDGISCGRVALNKANIKYKKYYASEIDKYAIKIAQKNYTNTIQIGDVLSVNGKDLPKIDLLIGGSPCQGFSFAGKQLNFNDPRSALFFEYVRILREVNPKYFLLENVKMKQEYQDVISDLLGVKPILINSNLVSAQNRKRLYWTNIPIKNLPEDKNIKLQDIIETTVEEKYYINGGRAEWLKKFGEIKEQRGYIAFNPHKAKCLTVRREPSWNTTYIVQMPHGTNNGGYKSDGW